MTDTATPAAPVTPAEDVKTEETTMSLAAASEILKSNALYAGMWEMTAPSCDRLSEIAESLRKVSISDKDVKDAISASEVKAVVSKRDQITKLREQAAQLESELLAEVKAALRGDDLSPEQEKDLREEFKSEKEKVNAFANAFLKIRFSGGDDGSPEYAALQTLLSASPTLRGGATKFGQKMTGNDLAAHVREWVKVNRSDIEISEKGRLPQAAFTAHLEGCADCKDKAAKKNGNGNGSK